MISDNNSGMVMPVSPMYGGYNNGGFGGGDYWWIILLLLCGWGGFGGGFGMGGFGGMMGLGYDFPWLLNGQQGINNNVSSGFRDQQIQTSISGLQNSVTSGFGDLNTALCNGFGNVQNSLCAGFAGVNATVNGAQNALSQQLNTNEIASLNRSFAEQTANMQGFNGVNSGVADLRYTVATEACANRTNDTQNTQSILTALTAGVQSIKDQLCQDKIDAKNDEIAQLRQEILYARGQSSQTAQTAQILAGQASEIDGVYNRLKNCPVPSMPVFGMTPIFQCQPQNNGGCGCGNFAG